MYDDETLSIIVEGNEGYQKAKNYMKLMMPKQLKKVKKFREKIPLFFKESIEKKLFEIFKSEVKLSSGGYLVINPTEALVSIDINSGQSTKQTNIEKTDCGKNGFSIGFRDNIFQNPTGLVEYINIRKEYISIRQDQRLFVKFSDDNLSIISYIKSLILDLLKIIEPSQS